MWTLVIFAAGISTAETVPNLSMCQQQYLAANLSDVREAYCQSAAGNDRVYIVKDGAYFGINAR